MVSQGSQFLYILKFNWCQWLVHRQDKRAGWKLFKSSPIHSLYKRRNNLTQAINIRRCKDKTRNQSDRWCSQRTWVQALCPHHQLHLPVRIKGATKSYTLKQSCSCHILVSAESKIHPPFTYLDRHILWLSEQGYHQMFELEYTWRMIQFSSHL